MLLRLRSPLAFPAHWTSFSGHQSPPTWTRPEVYWCSVPPRAESRESIADTDVFPRFTMQERMLRTGAGELNGCSRDVLCRPFMLILSLFSLPEPAAWVWRECTLLKVAVLSRIHMVIGQGALGKKPKSGWRRGGEQKSGRVSESGGLSLRVQNSAATVTDVNHRCRCFDRQVWFMSLIWHHDPNSSESVHTHMYYTSFCLQLWNLWVKYFICNVAAQT